MGKGEDLAMRFEQANADFMRAVEAVSNKKWVGKASDEERPVGVIAHHVASAIPAVVLGAQGVLARAKSGHLTGRNSWTSGMQLTRRRAPAAPSLRYWTC
jgi:hypothetical protein